MPRSKEQRDREMQLKFVKMFNNGTSQSFLHEDAKTTRNAFATWYSETYLKSDHGKSISKAVKADVHSLLNLKPPILITRDDLLPQTQAILRNWQEIPLEVGSPEHSKAVTRWVKDAAAAGLLHEALQSVIGERLSPKEIAEARNWLYIGPDGHTQAYQPINQPWYPKNLQWDARTDSFVTVIGVPDRNQPPNPTMSPEMPQDQELLRITTTTFEQLIQGEYVPKPREGDGNRSTDTVNNTPSRSASSIGGHDQSSVNSPAPSSPCLQHYLEKMKSRLAHEPDNHQPGTPHAQPNVPAATSPSYSPPAEWYDEPGPSEGGVSIDPEAQADFTRVWRPSPLPLFTSHVNTGRTAEDATDMGAESEASTEIGPNAAIEADCDSEMSTEEEESGEREGQGEAVVGDEEWDEEEKENYY
ncbi:MAG: hypothetical protein Q9207_001372 [Kuettlingeria erythrocarpa]